MDIREGIGVDRREGSGVGKREGSDVDRREEVMWTEGKVKHSEPEGLELGTSILILFRASHSKFVILSFRFLKN